MVSDLLDLIGLVYDAATEPSVWDMLLARCGNAVGSDMLALQVHDFRLNRSTILSAYGLAPRVSGAYHEQYSRMNPWRRLGQSKYRTGRALLSDELCAGSVLRNSEFYHDFLRRLKIEHSLAGVVLREQTHAVVLTALRGPEKADFGQEECEVLRLLLPHLLRAYRISQKLGVLGASESALDTLDYGVVFYTAGGTAVYWNRPAERMFEARDGLSLRGGRLCPLGASETVALDDAVERASTGVPVLDCPGAVLVSRGSAKLPYEIVVVPLRGKLPGLRGIAPPVAMAFIVDRDRLPIRPPAILEKLYRMTRKEAAVASLLGQGISLQDAAEALGMGHETAKTHLRHIFQKTSLKRQAELVALVARLPGTTDSAG